MRKLLSFGVLGVLLLGVASFASADDERGDYNRKHYKMVEKKDANSDGVISKAEFMAHAEKKFAKMDTDSNGSITSKEVESYLTAKKKSYKNEKGRTGQCNHGDK